MYRKIMDELIGEQTITLLLSNGKEVKVNGVLKDKKLSVLLNSLMNQVQKIESNKL